MDEVTNPYQPGAGIPPDYIAGRDEIRSRFAATLQRLTNGRHAAPPFLTGPTGSGKTVLLNELLEDAAKQGWFVASEEVSPGVPLANLIALMARDLLLDMSATKRVTERVKRALGVLKAFSGVSVAGVSLNIDVTAVEGTADSGLFERDLRNLFVELGETAKAYGSGALLGLDEVHTLAEPELDALHSALHLTGQKQLPVGLVSAGLFPSWMNGHEDSNPLRKTSYVARASSANYVRLEPLAPADAALALSQPALDADVKWTEPALERAVVFAEGNPWLLQLVGAKAWNLAPSSPITDEVVEEAEAQAQRQLDAWYLPRLLRRLSRTETALMAAIAEHEPPFDLTVLDPDGSHHDALWTLLEGIARQNLIDVDRYEVKAIVVPRLSQHLATHWNDRHWTELR